MILPTKQIVLEGCDLSGKTTFYGKFHKETNFAYDVRDRGPISRIVYSKIYDRDTAKEEALTNRFLDDLNNIVILLSPDWDIVSSRFGIRGDEFHNQESLLATWTEFRSLSRQLESHPSVFCFECHPDIDLSHDLVRSRESITSRRLSSYAQNALISTNRNESLDIQFEIIASPDDDLGPGVLLVPGETEYYASLKHGLISKIESELLGGQSIDSRRFVTTNDSCISYLRFIHREDHDIVDLVCRSTNISKNLEHDLNAIIHIAYNAQELLRIEKRNITFKVRLNCAHIIP